MSHRYRSHSETRVPRLHSSPTVRPLSSPLTTIVPVIVGWIVQWHLNASWNNFAVRLVVVRARFADRVAPLRPFRPLHPVSTTTWTVAGGSERRRK